MSSIENYSSDLGCLIAEKAREAKVALDTATETSEIDYRQGYLMAYHEVVSLMQQQADIFGIERHALGLEDIDPENELL